MSKAFTKESDGDDDDELEAEEARPKGPQYVTRAGYERLRAELEALWHGERPKVTADVQAAAAQGDRSENAEYIYGKKRLREIDGRLRFLGKRLEVMEVVDPTQFKGEVVRFGATVEIEDEDDGAVSRWTILGEDEVDTANRVISYVSPVGKALMGKKVGDAVAFDTPGGRREVTILSVSFPAR